MDAKKIIEIKDAYKAGTKTLAEASLELIMIGLSSDEVIQILD